MEKITRNNVEAWVLDYQEGVLSDGQTRKLLSFLDSNPDLDIDINFSDFLILEAPKSHYDGKADLFRTDLIIPEVSEVEIECIARLEGDMIPTEEIAFDKSLKDNKVKAELFQNLKKTILKPDFNIVFDKKSSLRKSKRIIPMNVYRLISAAAVIVLAWVIFAPRADVEDPLLVQESSREIIYLDKLANPSQFDLIAMSIPVKTLTESQTKVIEYIPERVTSMTIAGKLPLKTINSTFLDPDKSYAFVYRSLPYPEDTEYQTLLASVGDFMREKILGQEGEFVKNTSFSVWELADALLNKISSFLSLPVDLDREYNEEGQIESIAFDSRLVAFTTPVNGRRNRQ